MMTETNSQLSLTYRELLEHGMPPSDRFGLTLEGALYSPRYGVELEEEDAQALLDSHVAQWWLAQGELHTLTVSDPAHVVAGWRDGASYCQCNTIASAVLKAIKSARKSV